jgi:glycosyltransferase involved in cell wall biosynthesis
MVSTVEPRKGHAQVLDAFEQLWCAGSDAGKGLAHDVMPTDRLQRLRDWRDARLVIVGHPGWCVDQLKQRLESHPERGQRLFWLQHLSDAALLDLYASADLFLMASEGEGFGLPIVEAARHGLPLLLRDLPVFREIADGHAMWFADDRALAEALVSAFIALRDGTAPHASAMPMLSWQQSAEALAVQLLGSMTAATAHPEQPLDAKA